MSVCSGCNKAYIMDMCMPECIIRLTAKTPLCHSHNHNHGLEKNNKCIELSCDGSNKPVLDVLGLYLYAQINTEMN